MLQVLNVIYREYIILGVDPLLFSLLQVLNRTSVIEQLLLNWEMVSFKLYNGEKQKQ